MSEIDILLCAMSLSLLCNTLRYQPHVLAGSLSRRQSGRRAPGKPHPYGNYPWYSTWVVDQGPFRYRTEDGNWKDLEGPMAVVLPPHSGDRLELPVSTLFSWVEWGAIGFRRVSRQGGGPATKYVRGKEQPPSSQIWGVDLPTVLPESLFELTRTMIFRVNTLWWRTRFHQLQADAELARWISLLVQAGQEAKGSHEEFTGIEEEVKVLRDSLSQGIGVGEWAVLLGVHPRTLHRRCEQNRKETPHQILNRVRLERAEVLLLQPEASIPEVAKSCGFATREAFSSWFAHQKGESPGRWRRSVFQETF